MFGNAYYVTRKEFKKKHNIISFQCVYVLS